MSEYVSVAYAVQREQSVIFEETPRLYWRGLVFVITLYSGSAHASAQSIPSSQQPTA
jgi:hypothetical protein